MKSVMMEEVVAMVNTSTTMIFAEPKKAGDHHQNYDLSFLVGASSSNSSRRCHRYASSMMVGILEDFISMDEDPSSSSSPTSDAWMLHDELSDLLDEYDQEGCCEEGEIMSLFSDVVDDDDDEAVSNNNHKVVCRCTSSLPPATSQQHVVLANTSDRGEHQERRGYRLSSAGSTGHPTSTPALIPCSPPSVLQQGAGPSCDDNKNNEHAAAAADHSLKSILKTSQKFKSVHRFYPTHHSSPATIDDSPPVRPKRVPSSESLNAMMLQIGATTA